MLGSVTDLHCSAALATMI